MKLRALRRQLLCQYLATVGLLLAVAEGGIYGFFHWAGQRELDTVLRQEIDTLATAVQLEPDRVHIEAKGLLHKMRLLREGGVWQVLLDDGQTLVRSRDAPGDAGDLPAVGGAAPPAEEILIENTAYGGMPVRAMRLCTMRERQEKKAKRITMPARTTIDIRAVVDRSGADALVRRLGWYLAGGLPLLLGLAAIGGLLLIKRAVRPVELAFDRERRFAGAASHELRTPLTALRGEIEVTLRRERNGPEYVETLQRLDALVGRMTGLVEGLLVLARADAGHLLLGAGEFSTAELETAVMEVIQLLPSRERVTLICTADGTLKLIGDGLLLAMAVRNLVENALLYAPVQPVEVRIDANGRGGLQVTVSDHGPGLPIDVLTHFRQASAGIPRQTGSSGSSGLGLSIARAVVEAHGGQLSLANRTDTGCLATISLPAAQTALVE